MIFGEWVYGAFLIAAAIVFRFLPPRARGWWLAACGLGFYAYYAQAFLWLVIVEIVVIYVLTRQARRHVWAFVAALVATGGALVLIKYGWLVSSTAADAAMALKLGRLPTFPQLVLPLAISFFTFEFIHYVVDARKGILPPHSPVDFFAFALFFPTMVAGPIKRFESFQPQIAEAKVSAQDISDGATRIAIGLAKKIVIADTLAPLVSPLLSDAGVRGASPVTILTALLAFAFKIYMDFSGYSDIAIGSARLFGIRVPENFDWPYIRTSIARFWRHWHMSLTSWITDYVYIPLGGSRLGLGRTALNLVAAFAVSGLWHGAQWHFLAWGLYNGLLLAAYRFWFVLVRRPLGQRVPALAPGTGPLAIRATGAIAGWALTFSLVTLGWGLFIMPLDRFAEMLGRLL
jgi:alginate O-acetyltransferase complex protein AlgI